MLKFFIVFAVLFVISIIASFAYDKRLKRIEEHKKNGDITDNPTLDDEPLTLDENLRTWKVHYDNGEVSGIITIKAAGAISARWNFVKETKLEASCITNVFPA